MLGKVIIVNGQKKIQALTADTGTGAPVGSYLYLEKKSNPQGYLYCDGSTFDETVYPALYQYLGTNVLPDWREFSAVGAEQNTTSAVIATHDVFTQGQEKDDQIQNHEHGLTLIGIDDSGSVPRGVGTYTTSNGNTSPAESVSGGAYGTLRYGNVTRGKSKAVFIYIKATSGLTENQQEDVLNTINNNLSYSTEEHPTGAKWIDGKPIYRKVVEISVSGSNSWVKFKQVTEDVDTVITVIVWGNNDTDNMQKGSTLGGIYEGYWSYYGNSGMLIAGWTPRYAILEYTKTTD